MGVLACVLALTLAGPAGAITWHPPVRLTDSGDGYGSPGGLAAAGASAVVAVYTDTDEVVRSRRSPDGGLAWADPVQLSAPGREGARATVAAVGDTVDALWTQGVDCDTVCPLHYARSTDGGVTYGTARRLTAAGSLVLSSQVARRGPVVAVAWTEATSDDVLVRVSRDGGSSFSAARVLDHTTNVPRPVWGQGKDANVAVAVGKGSIIVAYFPSTGRLFVRRSTDGGATWKPRVRLATDVYSYDPPSIVASGAQAVIAYPHGSDPAWVVSRRTSDKGATWKPEVVISSQAKPSASGPILGVGGGRWVVAFDRCTTSDCPVTQVVARVSGDGGASWGAAQTVDTGAEPRSLAVPFGVDVGTRIVVAYWLADWDVQDGDVWTRSAD